MDHSTQLSDLSELKTLAYQVRRAFYSPRVRQAAIALAMGFALFLTAVALAWGVTRDSLQLYTAAGLLGLIFAVITLLRPEYGIYFLVFFVYCNLSHVVQISFGLPGLIKPLTGLLAVSLLVSRFMMRREKILINKTAIFLIAYWVVQLVSSFSARHEGAASEAVEAFAKDIVIFLMIINVADKEKPWTNSLLVFLFSGAFLATLSTYQALTGDYDQRFFELAIAESHQITGETDRPRVSGPIGDPNFYGQIILMTVPLAIYRILDEWRGYRRLIFAGVLFTLMVTIIFTYSRGAFLALVVLLLLVAIDRKVKPTVIVGVGLLIGLVVLPLLPAEYTARLQTLNMFTNLQGIQDRGGVRSIREASFQGRTSEAIIAFLMFKDHPLLGVAPNNYPKYYLDYAHQLGSDTRNEEREAHMLYLEVAAETGLLGLITFGLTLYASFQSMATAAKTFKEIGRTDLLNWVKGIRLGVASYLFTSLFLHAGFARYMWLLLALATAAEGVAMREKEQFDAIREKIERQREDYLERTRREQLSASTGR